MAMKVGIPAGADGSGGGDNDDADWLTTRTRVWSGGVGLAPLSARVAVLARRQSSWSTATGTDETRMLETVVIGRELDGTFGAVTTNDDGRDCCSRHRRWW